MPARRRRCRGWSTPPPSLRRPPRARRATPARARSRPRLQTCTVDPAGPVVGEADNANVTASVTSNPAVQTGGGTASRSSTSNSKWPSSAKDGVAGTVEGGDGPRDGHRRRERAGAVEGDVPGDRPDGPPALLAELDEEEVERGPWCATRRGRSAPRGPRSCRRSAMTSTWGCRPPAAPPRDTATTERPATRTTERTARRTATKVWDQEPHRRPPRSGRVAERWALRAVGAR